MAVSSSEGTGEERGGGVALYVRDCFDCIELDNCDDKVKCLWVKMRGKASKADILLWGSVIDHPTGMKRQMKFSARGWQKSHNH